MNWMIFAVQQYRVVKVESGIDWPLSIGLSLLITSVLWLVFLYSKRKPPKRKRWS